MKDGKSGKVCFIMTQTLSPVMQNQNVSNLAAETSQVNPDNPLSCVTPTK